MKKIILTLFIAFFIPFNMVHAQTVQPVVHAVLFYSPTCGHCEFVINQTILPMIDKHGGQLQVVGVDVTTQDGNTLFISAMQAFNVKQAGVPFLVIDDIYLIGSTDIPEQFPTLVQTYLAQGGVDFPNIPGLQEAISTDASLQMETLHSTPLHASTAPAFPAPTVMPDVNGGDMRWTEKFMRDPVGNTLSVIVLLGMLGSLGWGIAFFRKGDSRTTQQAEWARIIPMLCVIGFGVAGYLAFVETAQTTAVCGPVGDCNTVQQSEYARLFGILPIGVLGLLGYIAILVSWFIAKFAKNKLANLAVLAMLFLTVSGTLFSIYLTFLEPFVIGATCIWCLTSAILITVLMLLAARYAKTVFHKKLFDRVRH